LTTRVDGEDTAKYFEFDRSGKVISYVLYICGIDVREKSVAGQRGTIVTVRDLFRGFPVRLEQAKKHRVNLVKVKSLILSYAFVRQFRVCLQVRGNRRVDWTVQGSSDAMSVVATLYGKEFVQRYSRFTWENEDLSIVGILPKLDQGSSCF
jgi:DNA mismatch repair ATPase MutL